MNKCTNVKLFGFDGDSQYRFTIQDIVVFRKMYSTLSFIPTNKKLSDEIVAEYETCIKPRLTAFIDNRKTTVTELYEFAFAFDKFVEDFTDQYGLAYFKHIELATELWDMMSASAFLQLNTEEKEYFVGELAFGITDSHYHLDYDQRQEIIMKSIDDKSEVDIPDSCLEDDEDIPEDDTEEDCDDEEEECTDWEEPKDEEDDDEEEYSSKKTNTDLIGDFIGCLLDKLPNFTVTYKKA